MLFVLHNEGWNTLQASKFKALSRGVIGYHPSKFDWPPLFLSSFDDSLKIGSAA
jgi:hypothetical protein